MQKMTTRRKLAIASWDSPREGNIYGKLTLDVEEVLRYLAWVREETGEKVTVTHFVGRVVAEALGNMPGLNGRIFLGKYRPHDTVNIAFLVALEEGQDLAKAKVEQANQKSVAQIAQQLREQAGRLRKGEDADFNKSKGAIKALPTWVLKRLISLTGWLASCWGVSIPALGVEPFPFGAAVITSVGMLGVDEGFAPPTPFAHVPVYVLIGAMADAPAVVDGALSIRKRLIITATLDHRFVDGFQGGILAKTARELFANPWALEGLKGPPVTT